MRKLKVFKIEADKFYYVATTNKKSAIALLVDLEYLDNTNVQSITEVTGEDLHEVINMGFLGEMTFANILSWLQNPMYICTMSAN